MEEKLKNSRNNTQIEKEIREIGFTTISAWNDRDISGDRVEAARLSENFGDNVTQISRRRNRGDADGCELRKEDDGQLCLTNGKKKQGKGKERREGNTERYVEWTIEKRRKREHPGRNITFDLVWKLKIVRRSKQTRIKLFSLFPSFFSLCLSTTEWPITIFVWHYFLNCRYIYVVFEKCFRFHLRIFWKEKN